jgi:hypothetical protein
VPLPGVGLNGFFADVVDFSFIVRARLAIFACFGCALGGPPSEARLVSLHSVLPSGAWRPHRAEGLAEARRM